MGIYHYLKVKELNGTQHDIGGYSKGAAQPHWFLSVSPLEYQNTLEIALEKKNLQDVFIGYVTTVDRAIGRLERVKEGLVAYQKGVLYFAGWKHLRICEQKVDALLAKLRRFNPQATLILDQSDTAPYQVKWDGQHMIGLQPGWYANEAAATEQVLDGFRVYGTNATESMAIKTFSWELPEKDMGFLGELQLHCAETERGCGPSLVTEFILAFNGTEDEPRALYREITEGLLSLDPAALDGKHPHEAERSMYVMDCLITVYTLMQETLDFLNLYRKAGSS